MVKLVAMYKTPDNTEAFDRHFQDIHTPLVKRWEGLRRLEVSKITAPAIGEPTLYLLEEMYFNDEESMQRALASPDGRTATMDITEFAGKLVTIFSAEVQETYGQ